MIKLTGAEYMIQLLEEMGVRTVFGYPGGANLPIYDALPKSPIKTVLVRNEQGAALAANGYAKATGGIGVCLATSGPGGTNLLTGIADSFCDSIPVIALTGQVYQHLIGTDAFQETDMTGVFAPVTKKTYLITDPQDIEHIFCSAYKTAISGRPGPVLIDLPKDVQNAEITLPDDWREQFTLPEIERPWNASDEDIKKAAEILKTAKKPLILSGHGIILAQASEAFRAFVKKEQIPAISTILGRDALRSDDPLYFSWLGMHGMKYANLAVQEADVILALGMRFDDRITGKLETFAPNAQIIHVDVDRSEQAKNVPTACFLHGDVQRFFEKWHPTIDDTNKADRAAWIQELQKLKEKYPLKYISPEHFTETAAIATLAEKIPENAIVTTDVGQHQMWSGQYLKNLEPGNFMTSGGLGTMGYGLPAAMGAQEGAPNTEVWCISGDGSFQMNLQELMTCTQENWPVKILILDNSYLGMVRQWQEKFYGKNYSGVSLDNPDFVQLAKAFRIDADEVNSVDELTWAIERAQANKGPYLIHAKVLKEQNVYPMVPPGKSLEETLYYPE